MRFRPSSFPTLLVVALFAFAAGGRLAGATSAALTIVLPQQVVASQPATLAVLGPDGHLAAGSVVEFSGGERVTTDATGRATFTAPEQPGVLLARLLGTDVNASATVVAAATGPNSVLRVTEVPRLIALNDRFAVTGLGFRGEAEANLVRVGRKPAVVLAASPVSLVILPGPQTAPGPAQVEVQAGSASAAMPTTLVSLELSSAKQTLAPGEKAALFVRARGAEMPLDLEVRNLTRDVVRLSGGDLQRVTTRGGGDNTAELELEGLRAGDYSISVRLVPQAAGLPDVEAARQHLLSALRIAPRRWRARVEKLAEQLEHHPQDWLEVRNQLEKMLAEKPKGEFGRRLEAAWRVLLNRSAPGVSGPA